MRAAGTITVVVYYIPRRSFKLIHCALLLQNCLDTYLLTFTQEKRFENFLVEFSL